MNSYKRRDFVRVTALSNACMILARISDVFGFQPIIPYGKRIVIIGLDYSHSEVSKKNNQRWLRGDGWL